ncbi:MAG: ABC transporter permease [Bacteroidales bacterium]|nr:ABC transporter permease [Bacteroidales bacterium]
MIKILCLACGLALGLVLIAKVYYEGSFDTFFPDYDRTYLVQTDIVSGTEDPKKFDQVSGAIAPAMVAEIPQVEAATRLTFFSWRGDQIISPSDDSDTKVASKVYFADSCFFDVFPLPIITGNPSAVLSQPYGTMVSRSLANKLGGVEQVLGKSFSIDDMPNFTVQGVFVTTQRF